jgi:hypothetical protein
MINLKKIFVTIALLLFAFIIFLVGKKVYRSYINKPAEKENPAPKIVYQGEEAEIRGKIAKRLEKLNSKYKATENVLSFFSEEIDILNNSEQSLARIKDFLNELAEQGEKNEDVEELVELVQQYQEFLNEYWQNIHQEFIDEDLRHEWLTFSGFKEKVKDWISNIGFSPHEHNLVRYLVKVKKGDYAEPEWVLNNSKLEDLKKEYQEYLKKKEEPKVTNLKEAWEKLSEKLEFSFNYFQKMEENATEEESLEKARKWLKTIEDIKNGLAFLGEYSLEMEENEVEKIIEEVENGEFTLSFMGITDEEGNKSLIFLEGADKIIYPVSFDKNKNKEKGMKQLSEKLRKGWKEKLKKANAKKNPKYESFSCDFQRAKELDPQNNIQQIILLKKVIQVYLSKIDINKYLFKEAIKKIRISEQEVKEGRESLNLELDFENG